MGTELNYHMTRRETGLYFLIDTNRINARRLTPNMNQMDKWKKDGVIGLIMSGVAHDEAKAGHNAEGSRKASRTVYTLSYTHEHAATMKAQIAAILFPGGCHSQNEQNDVLIVYDTWRQHPWPLITADGDILRKRDELAALGITVMTDAEAVALVKKRILERDDEARADAAYSGEPLPWWVGKD
jgi:hypothetical protein